MPDSHVVKQILESFAERSSAWTTCLREFGCSRASRRSVVRSVVLRQSHRFGTPFTSPIRNLYDSNR